MKLSNKQRKYIKRHAGKKTPADLATALRIPIKQVKTVLREDVGIQKIHEKRTDYPISYWLLAAIIFLAPLAVVNGNYEYSKLPKQIVVQLGTLLILLSFFAEGWRRESLGLVKCKLYGPLLCFFGWALASSLWSTNRYDAFTLWMHWGACGLIFFLSIQLFATPDSIKRLLALLVGSALLVSLLGIGQYLFEIDWILQRTAPSSTFGNKNMAAQFIVLCFPMSVVQMISAREKKQVWFAASALSCLSIYLFYTFTRTAWLAVLVELFLFVLFFLCSRNNVKRESTLRLQKTTAVTVAVCVTFVMINLTPAGLKWQIGDAFNSVYYVFSDADRPTIGKTDVESEAGDYGGSRDVEDHGTSFRIRLIVWRNTIDLIKAHLFTGVGLNNFGIQYPTTAINKNRENALSLYRGPLNTHNDPLQIASELGLPGILLILWALVVVFSDAHIAMKPHFISEKRITATACFIGMAGLAVNSLASFPMYRSVPPLLLAVFAAVICRSSMGKEEDPDTGEQAVVKNIANKRVISGMIILTLVLICVGSTVQLRRFVADRYSRHRVWAMAEKRWSDVIGWSKKILHYHPRRYDAVHALGRAYFETGAYQEALGYLLQYRSVYPHTTHNLFILAKTYEALKEYRKAEQVLDHLIAILPENAEAHNVLGRVYGHLGRDDDAIKAFLTAIEIEPSASNFHLNLGVQLYKGKRWVEAAEAFEEAVRLDESSTLARRNLGLTLFHYLNRRREGVKHLKAVLALDPDVEGAESLRATIAAFEKRLSDD